MKPISRASRASTTAEETPAALSTSYTVGTSNDKITSQTTRGSRPNTRARTATSTLGLSGNHEIICAITESRGVSPTVGLAFVNLLTAEAVLCQIVDNQSYVKTLHKLAVLDPTTSIVPQTAVVPVKSKLIHVLQTNLRTGVTIKSAPRKYWDETAGIDYINRLAFEDEVETIKVSVGGNFFAVCCLAAVLQFIDLELGFTFSFHSMRMRYEPSEGSMMIDLPTIRSLELIENLQDPRSKHCLFGLLNTTLSPMGCRLLRGNLLQPLTEKGTLERRYDAVEDLLGHQEMFQAVRDGGFRLPICFRPAYVTPALKGSLDLDKVLTEIVIIPARPAIPYWEQSINNVLLLKQCIRSVPPLFEALTEARSELLQQIRQYFALSMYEKVLVLIDSCVNKDVTYQKKPIDLRNQRTYAVKCGVNGLLDVARQTYTEASCDAEKLREELSTTHDLNLELKFDTGRQFYIALPASDLEDRALPAIFVNAVKKKQIIECSTLDLVKLNQKIVDSHHEVLQMSETVIQNLVDKVRADIAPLFKISDSIALLDMVAAFADLASRQDYCRPELITSLAIQCGRHPIHEKIHSHRFIPNDVYADNKMSRVQIITGCNMSGKSTYIRSIALMTVMAQAGSFVPASYASIPIRHQVFARLSIDDSSASGISTFAEEMREMAFILRNIDARALVIVDELGRGTSTRDGLAIAIAVVEALLQSRALVWFVTHFQDLATFLAERPGLVNKHLQVDIQENSHVSMLYKVAEGPTPPEDHGLMLARAVGLPPTVLNTATIVSDTIKRAARRTAQTSQAIFQARRAKLLFSLKQQLLAARDGKLTGDKLTDWLQDLQNEFVRRMSALDEEERQATTNSSDLTVRGSDCQDWRSDGQVTVEASQVHGLTEGQTSSPSPVLLLGESPEPGTDDRYFMAGAL